MPESKRFLLRLHPRLFEALRHWAEDDLRSINAQIEFLLADQARRAGRLPRRRTRPPQVPESPEAEEDDETSRPTSPHPGVRAQRSAATCDRTPAAISVTNSGNGPSCESTRAVSSRRPVSPVATPSRTTVSTAST
jgi:hypothetical protein